jgi:hypothetical protein
MARLFDNAGAKDWLEGKPNVAHVAFAARSAARSLARLGEANEATLDQITLPVMRAIITSVAVSIKFEAEIKFAADRSFPDAGDATVVARAAGAISAAFVAASADNAADCAASSGNKSSAAAAASTGASAFQSSEAAFWCETSLDAETLEAGTPEQLWTTKLWRLNDGPPQDAIATLSALRAYWLKNSAIWGFWERWYDGMLNGQPLPWDFQEAVALIPGEIWEDGAEAVAAEIAKIEFKFRTSAVQRLVRNNGTGVFEPEKEALPPDEVAGFVCKRIENALNAALQSVSPNIFNENSYEVIVIRDTLASEPRTISILATGFFDAGMGLQKNNGTLYPEEVALTNLINALGAATDELCELDDDAKRRCALLAGYNPRKSVDDLPVEDLLHIPDTVADHVNDPARKIIESDVERALSKESPPTKTIRIRLSNWLTTISIWMDRAMKGDKKAKWLAEVVKRLREWWPNE